MSSPERAGNRPDPGFFDAYLKAWSDHDVDAVLEYFTDDCVFEDVALGRVNHGKSELAKFAGELFSACPDVRFESESGGGSAEPGGRYAGEWTMAGTHEGDFPGLPATHKRFSVRGVSVGELEGAKIKRNSDYYNFADVLAQLGAIPSPAT